MVAPRPKEISDGWPPVTDGPFAETKDLIAGWMVIDVETYAGVLVRRGADFATAEDAVQEALIRALASWPNDPPAPDGGLCALMN